MMRHDILWTARLVDQDFRQRALLARWTSPPKHNAHPSITKRLHVEAAEGLDESKTSSSKDRGYRCYTGIVSITLSRVRPLGN